MKDNLVPGSDCAGEILSVGEHIQDWKQGDKVCVHVSPTHICGRPSAQTHDAFGGTLDGVLVEYRTFPAHVSAVICVIKPQLIMWLTVGAGAHSGTPFV